MRVSDFSMLWTPKLDSVGGSYNGQLSCLHQQASRWMVWISSQAHCNLHQARVAVQKRGFAHCFWCTSSRPHRTTMSDMKLRLVILSQLSSGFRGSIIMSSLLYVFNTVAIFWLWLVNKVSTFL